MRRGRILRALFVSMLVNLFYAFVSYILISWPREILRNSAAKVFSTSKGIKNVQLLNPIRYIDPIGILAFAFFDFGWTRSPLIDYPKAKKKDLFFYSLFGIVSSFLLFFAPPIEPENKNITAAAITTSAIMIPITAPTPDFFFLVGC